MRGADVRDLLRRLRPPFRCARCGLRVIIGVESGVLYGPDLRPHVCKTATVEARRKNREKTLAR